MKLCEHEHGRKVYRLKPTDSIRSQCNRVECTKIDGTKCECWMTYPNEEDQPNHDRSVDIIIDEREDKGIDINYYGMSAMLMGAAGIILFLCLWAAEAGLF